MKIDAFRAQLEQINTFYEAESRRIDGTSRLFSGEAAIYASDGEVESARVRADTTQYEATVRKAQIDANLALEQARTNIAQLQRILTLEQEGIQTIANVQAQLTASSMAAVNLSAQVTERADNSTSCNVNYAGEI